MRLWPVFDAELTDDLIDRVGEQSDARAGATSLRDYEALCDACLVAVMNGLAQQDCAAGEVLEARRATLRDRARAT